MLGYIKALHINALLLAWHYVSLFYENRFASFADCCETTVYLIFNVLYFYARTYLAGELGTFWLWGQSRARLRRRLYPLREPLVQKVRPQRYFVVRELRDAVRRTSLRTGSHSTAY